MNTRVKLSGVPKNVRLAKLLALLRKILCTNSTDFFAHVPPIKGPVKDVLLTFSNQIDAKQAREKLDNFVYIYGNETYVFSATIDTSYQRKSQPKEDRYKKNMQQYYEPTPRYSREESRGRYRDGPRCDRSRSPHYSDESARLDMQIEILRKQRLILEEERKLLEEQERLDNIKMRSLKNEKHSVSERSFNEEYISNDDERPQDAPEKAETDRKFIPNVLSYHKASGVLLGKMYALVEKYSTKETRKLLTSLIRPALKQRLATALEGQPIYQTHKIIQLYRAEHPVTEDEEFVKEHAERMGSLNWPDDSMVGARKGNDDIATGGPGNHYNAIEENATEELCDAIHTEIERERPAKVSGKKMKLVYHQATAILIKKLNVHLDNHAPLEKRTQLVALLRAAVKKRLEKVVADKEVYQSNKIIKFYRVSHPATEDEDFVKSYLKKIEQGPGDDISKTDSKASESKVVESGPQGDVIDKNAPANTTQEKSKEINENKTLQNVKQTKSANDSGFMEEVGDSTEAAKGNVLEKGKVVGSDNLLQEKTVVETTTEAEQNEPTSEDTNASDTTDKPKDFNENESLNNIKESVENINDVGPSKEMETATVVAKDDNASKDADTAVELHEKVITGATQESGPDTNKTSEEEKNDIQINTQENSVTNMIGKSGADQPVLNTKGADFQSDVQSDALAQNDADTNTESGEINRGTKRKNDDCEETEMKVAKSSVLVTSDGVYEINLVKADD